MYIIMETPNQWGPAAVHADNGNKIDWLINWYLSFRNDNEDTDHDHSNDDN